jgi:hypothetical protein
MRLLHHHDDDKEFFSWCTDTYDDGMHALPLLAPVLLHIALAIPPGAGLRPLALATAIAEAAAIWAPYGVAVDLAGHCDASVPDTALLRVEVVTARRASSGGFRPPLGAIVFDDGEPSQVITVFLADIDHFLSTAHVLGFNHELWPTLLRDRALGRVAGRVIAHEIGHYLLQTRQHDASGLMRAMQSADDFVAPVRAGFALSKPTEARFARLHPALQPEDEDKKKRPADAGHSDTTVKREPR